MKHSVLFCPLIILTACNVAPQITETDMGQYHRVEQTGGATLGYSPESGKSLTNALIKKGFTLVELIVVMAIMSILLTAVMSLTGPATKINKRVKVGENTYAMANNIQTYIQRNLEFADAAWIFTGDETDRVTNLRQTVSDFKNCYYNNVVVGKEGGCDYVHGAHIYVMRLINQGDDAGQIGLRAIPFDSDKDIEPYVFNSATEELVLNPAYFVGDSADYNITYALNSSELENLGEVNSETDPYYALESEKNGETVRNMFSQQSVSIVVNSGTKTPDTSGTNRFTKFEGPANVTIANIPFTNISSRFNADSSTNGLLYRTVKASDGSDEHIYKQGPFAETPLDLNYQIPSYISAMTISDLAPFYNLAGQVSTEKDIYIIYAYGDELKI